MADDNVAADRPDLDEWQRVLRWREKQLAAAGLDEKTALALALVPDLDWHRVAGCCQAGAPPALLIRIFT